MLSETSAYLVLIRFTYLRSLFETMPLNLSLSASHKLLLMEKGVLRAALTCLRDSEWPHVHFKCLGIARLLANQQGEMTEVASTHSSHYSIFISML